MVDALLLGIAIQTNSGVPTRYAEQQLFPLQRCSRCPSIHRPLSEMGLGSGGEIYRQRRIEWSQSNPLTFTWLPDTEAITKHDSQREAASASENPIAEDVPYKLAFVKAAFALNMSELASTLRTTRPSVYTWAKGETDLHTHNAERLNHIYELAKIISERTGDKSSLVRRNRDGLSSIVNLLSADVVVGESVLKAVDAMSRHRSAASSRRAARKAFALKHNLQLPSSEESQEKVDVLTGKRGSNQS